MKNLKQINKELIKALPSDTDILTHAKGWLFYSHLTGFYSDRYFDICISKDIDGIEEIKIGGSTKDQPFFVELIKGIEPLSKITCGLKINL